MCQGLVSKFLVAILWMLYDLPYLNSTFSCYGLYLYLHLSPAMDCSEAKGRNGLRARWLVRIIKFNFLSTIQSSCIYNLLLDDNYRYHFLFPYENSEGLLIIRKLIKILGNNTVIKKFTRRMSWLVWRKEQKISSNDDMNYLHPNNIELNK